MRFLLLSNLYIHLTLMLFLLSSENCNADDYTWRGYGGNNEKVSFESNDLKLITTGRVQLRATEFFGGGLDEGSDIDTVEIERGRIDLEVSSPSLPLLTYINLDIDTDDDKEFRIHDFWIHTNLNNSVGLFLGRAFVPGSREWLDGSTTTLFSDRSLATSFFRPDRSQGVWLIGSQETLSYRLMLSNGLFSPQINDIDVDGGPAIAGSIWFEPFGEYGTRGDLEIQNSLLLRFGASFTFRRIQKTTGGSDELSELHLLSSNTLGDITEDTHNLQVEKTNFVLYSFDASLKYQRFILNSEYFVRSLNNITDKNNTRINSFLHHGGSLEVSYFIISKTLQFAIRTSQIMGEGSSSSEYASGLTYYPTQSHLNKFTLDFSILRNTAVSSSGPNFIAGSNGVLGRLQWQIGF